MFYPPKETVGMEDMAIMVVTHGGVVEKVGKMTETVGKMADRTKGVAEKAKIHGMIPPDRQMRRVMGSRHMQIQMGARDRSRARVEKAKGIKIARFQGVGVVESHNRTKEREKGDVVGFPIRNALNRGAKR